MSDTAHPEDPDGQGFAGRRTPLTPAQQEAQQKIIEGYEARARAYAEAQATTTDGPTAEGEPVTTEEAA